jgi:hypothetical protein
MMMMMMRPPRRRASAASYGVFDTSPLATALKMGRVPPLYPLTHARGVRRPSNVGQQSDPQSDLAAVATS